MPVFGTIASQFNDPGMNQLYKAMMDKIAEKTGADLKASIHYHTGDEGKDFYHSARPHPIS